MRLTATDGAVWSVDLVCWSWPWALQKWLNWSWCDRHQICWLAYPVAWLVVWFMESYIPAII